MNRRYEILGTIGRGGMGEVLEARDLMLKRLVALKVVTRASPEAAMRLEREGRLIAAVSHPNICDVFDVGMLEGGIPYLVLERLEGETLAVTMKRRKPQPLALVVEVFSQVLAALQCAHTRGVVHRDLKPANVFLVRRGGLRVKLLDFGLAKDIFNTNQGTAVTKPGRAVGTPAYMSPEQLLGRPVDGRSDLFSVGIMLFEMLTRRHPFGAQGANVTELASNIVHGEHPKLLALRSVPPRLAQLVESALTKDRESRPATALAFDAELLASTVDERTSDLLSDAPPSSTGNSDIRLPRLDLSTNDSTSNTSVGGAASSTGGSTGVSGPRAGRSRF